ncbi:MAG: hypothetical protein IJN09_06145, partial [Oscillospiraceae bacterium]|nr:hypothetical protein [Oscillospiraceae bacterium]
MGFKKSIALLLSLVMMLTFAAPIVSAADTASSTPTVSVQSVTDIAGATVNVAVSIANNPGILGATLQFEFNEGLTLVSVESGEAFSALTMTKPGKFTSPCKFVWDGQEISDADIKDGTILTLQFRIDENAEAGDEYAINVSYDDGDILDTDIYPVDIDIINGGVTVIDYLYGDLNSDQKINAGDIIFLRRHVAGGYEQNINEAAGDVNLDGKLNTGDIIFVRRYVAGGYDIALPIKPVCTHSMVETDYKAPACEEVGNIAYWYCTSCNKYFSDAKGMSEIKQEDTVIAATGHTVVIDAAVEATYESEGLTEGSHCSVCEKVLVAQVVIPPLEKDEYSITYEIANGEDYIGSAAVYNPNPATYATQDGLELQDLAVPGYYFL